MIEHFKSKAMISGAAAADNIMVSLVVNIVKLYVCMYIYSAFFLTVAIGNCMVKLIPPVNFCSDENIQTIFGTRCEDFLNYRTEYNSIS
jgi:hypothetical protein